MTDTQKTARTLRGSCHCGAVRFEVEADVGRGASRCNCSICTKLGAFGGMVKPQAFKLLSDESELGQYRWGVVSTRYFCKQCGTHCYGRGNLPELGGEFVGFSYNTIDELELSELQVVYWDGRHDNWQAGPSDKPWPMLTPSKADSAKRYTASAASSVASCERPSASASPSR